MTGALYDNTTWVVRDDISVMHLAWLDHVARPGGWWTGEQRVAFVDAVWTALDDRTPAPPWVRPVPPNGSPLPAAAHAVAYRLARHAATVTADWYRRVVDELGEPAAAYVELVGLAATACAVDGFSRSLGISRPRLPTPVAGEPTRHHPELVDARMNWVPVTAPADTRAAVVQALTAAPAENDMLWAFATVHYMADEEMDDLDWRRPGSPLDRRQLELVASRLSLVRECFF